MATDRPTTGELEQRTADAAVDNRRVHGLVPYGIRADLGSFTEEIAPGALRDTDLRALVAVIDHEDRGLPLARFPGSLHTEHRDDGLAWSFEPPRSRQDVIEALERGDIAGSSWRMRVAPGGDRWEGDHRVITRIAELRDITLAASQQPAYPTAVELRTKTDNDPASAEEASAMADQADTQQDQQQDEQRTTEDSGGLHISSTGSLRVNERTELPTFTTLADLYETRGYFENRSASVTWDEFRAFTWSAGTVLTDLNPVRREGVGLGYDSRWLYPVLPTTAVSDATTSIQYLRQSARTLAGTAVIRALDAVSTKPETATTVEYQTLQLSQVASVVSNIPRIHAAQPMFQSLVEADLRYSINDGLDELVRRGVATAGTAASVTGDILQKVRRAMTVVGTAGYNADVLAIDPAGAEALDLLQTSGSEKMYVFTAGAAAPAPYGLRVRVWKQAGTAILDSQAFGRLYVAPVELRSFEQDAGATNRQTLRMETNAGYAVERVPAALRIL